MSAPTEIRPEELHAYLDGELEDPRRAEIKRLIELDPSLAARLAAFGSDKEMIAHTYGPLMGQPLSPKWISQIERHGARARPRVLVLAALAASLILLVIGTAVLNPVVPRSVVADALSARDNSLRPVAITSWRSQSGFRAASGIVAKTLGMKLRAPDLSEMGYSLTTIRIYPTATMGNAVELIYRGPRHQDFTLFLRRAMGGQPRFDVFERGDVRVCLWQDEDLATVMAGRMSAAEMQRLASLAYNGLSA